MAADIFLFDPLAQPVAEILSGARAIRDARDRLQHARDVLIRYRSGDGSLASHYALFATKCSVQAGGYADANTAAKAIFDELDSMISKLLTDASVSAVFTAANQLCAKLGV
jgi:hypothetical protein